MPHDSSMPTLPREIAAWLETIAAESGDTIRQNPDSTIVPPHAADTAGKRALALLEKLGGADPTASAQLETGETIGQGGMGIVRLAEQVALGRTVAVKTLRPDRQSQDATLDLLREAWVTGAVEHPNVVPIYAIGLDTDGSPLIVLKRIEGTEWAELMNDPDAVHELHGAGDLLEWNLQILMQVLNALRFAHSRGIVHRDVKPENVMVGRFGEVYLLDWGIAVSLRDDPSGRLPHAKDASEMAGTPCYMAPEMLGPERGLPLSERTDVYLAGAVIYELIAGEPPHMGESAIEVITSVATSRPEIPAGAPPELARVCLRAMHPDPDKRFESADALHRALQAYLEHRGSEQIAARARADLDELRARLDAPADSDTDSARREQIYGLFGACRFGFHQALSTWPDNPEAHAGLADAARAVAEFELVEGDPRAAVGLLAELDDPPADLLARARDAARERDRRDAELAELERRLDWTIGTRTRTFLALVLGSVFTLFPLLGDLVFDMRASMSYGSHLAWACALLAIVLALGYWARESMSKTLVNRRVFAAVLFLFVSQSSLYVGFHLAGVHVVVAELAMMFLWFALSGMFVIAIDRRLWLSSMAFLAAFLVAARWPEQRFFAMSAANLVLTVNAAWVWRPATVRWTDEERAARGLSPRR